jgi:hypothetical protein
MALILYRDAIAERRPSQEQEQQQRNHIKKLSVCETPGCPENLANWYFSSTGMTNSRAKLRYGGRSYTPNAVRVHFLFRSELLLIIKGVHFFTYYI